MGDAPIVRLATAADAAELARLRWDASLDEVATWAGDRLDYLRDFEAFVGAAQDGDWSVWVADVGGRLVGNVWLQRVRKVPRPGAFGGCWGYVTNVYVEEVFRNAGLGSRLLEAAIDSARRAGWELLLVWPSERSVPFYERAGFRRSAEALELDLTP